MTPIQYHSTNTSADVVDFETALLLGQPSDFGLYMVKRADIPRLQPEHIKNMAHQTYAQIAMRVLNPYLCAEIPEDTLEALLEDAYREDKIPTTVQHVTRNAHILWLTQGPTYSFKDYAARFFGRILNYYLDLRGLRRTVVVATSGDTGGAVADALYGLDNVDTIVLYPKDTISEAQRRQMTTLKQNIYAFEVNANFDVCQVLAKKILWDKEFTTEIFNDEKRFTSANSISVGRLLPQSVYPFFAYSRVAKYGEPMIASIPSGNFGDMMGTVLAKAMGLPVERILCGVNENSGFSEFMETGRYRVERSKVSPSSAMNVSHPSNLARLIDFYGGHIFDRRDKITHNVVRPGIIDRMPNLKAMRKDISSVSINNSQHYQTMKEVYDVHGIILDPHGAVGWRAMESLLGRSHRKLAVVYETADPGKFPCEVEKAIGKTPKVPDGMKRQALLEERIYSIHNPPVETEHGLELSNEQILETYETIRSLFKAESL